MRDDKITVDEERRVAQHEKVRGAIERDVDSEITTRADRTTGDEAVKMERVAGDFRERAIEDVVKTEREVVVGRGVARGSQVVDYIFGVLYALLGLRLLLALMAARSSAPFVQFITAVTEPFYAPFKGMVASPATDEGHTLLLPLLIGIVVYMLLHLGIKGLMRMVAHRRTEI